MRGGCAGRNGECTQPATLVPATIFAKSRHLCQLNGRLTSFERWVRRWWGGVDRAPARPLQEPPRVFARPVFLWRVEVAIMATFPRRSPGPDPADRRRGIRSTRTRPDALRS